MKKRATPFFHLFLSYRKYIVDKGIVSDDSKKI